ncbi:carbohydrate kinase family protein [Microlunatus ginsengisoli]|uniref:Carbohydrate kinase family protein n=1 Tax=Microlunatus ginsengisoli TaxID=363863 RepID=A0ABP6ZSB1_9ACTN
MSHRSPDRAGVLCAGSVMVDVSKVIDSYPARDHVARIESVSISSGGPGLNLAVDLRRLGAEFPVALAGVIGDDEHGDLVVEECRRLGIDVARLTRVPGGRTAFTDVMVEKIGGRRTFFHHAGVNDAMDLSTLDLSATTERIFHVGAPGLHETMDAPLPDGGNRWARLLDAARSAGLQTNLELVSLQADRLREVALSCLPRLDSIVINEVEAAAMTGAEIPAGDDVDWPAMEDLARKLLALGVRRVAVIHFPAGGVAVTADGRSWRHGSVRLAPEQVVSTLGAGDAFASGVILGLHEGWPMERVLRLAVSAAAACVQSLGTSDGIRSAETCLAAAEAAGFRPVP